MNDVFFRFLSGVLLATLLFFNACLGLITPVETCNSAKDCKGDEVCLLDRGSNRCLEPKACLSQNPNGPQACLKGEDKCVNKSKLQRCSRQDASTGCWYLEKIELCPDGTTCNGGKCTCSPNSCKIGNMRCTGGGREVCVKAVGECGKWKKNACPSDKKCKGDQCVCRFSCKEGETHCQDGRSRTCKKQSSGCTTWKEDTKQHCSDKKHCIDDGGKLSCLPACLKNGDCSNATCQVLPSSQEGVCSARSGGPTVESLCKVKVISAKIKSKYWDLTSKPDPFVLVNLPGERSQSTKVLRENDSPTWDFTSEEAPYGKIAKMTIELRDDDHIPPLPRLSELIGKWQGSGGTWSMSQMTQGFALTTSTSTLNIQISCK